MMFPDMHAACAAVKPFVDCGAAAVELTDRASLRAVEGKPGVPERWKALPEAATALLVEFRARTRRRARPRSAARIAMLAGLARCWSRRSSPAIPRSRGAVLERAQRPARVGRRRARPSGTSFILEDVCFPPERLADGALDLQALFGRHGYAGVIFGHASAGNLHFLITPLLNEAARDRALRRLHAGRRRPRRRQVRRLAQGRARHRAQHRAVRRARVGREADRADVEAEAPRRPGRHPRAGRDARQAIRGTTCTHLQTAPTSRPRVDRCIQCGYCERVCPSREPDHHAAAAHRAAAGDGAAGRRLAGARRAAARLRLRRDPDLRRRRQLRARLPGRASTPAR